MGHQFVTAVDVALSGDGEVAQLQFVKADGRATFVDVPAAQAGALMLDIQHALGGLVSKDLPNGPNKKATAHNLNEIRRVSRVDANSVLGMSVLSLLLASGAKLDFALDRRTLRDVIARLQELEAEMAEKPKCADKPPERFF